MNIRDAMLSRRSIRTYKEELLSQELRQNITDYIDTVKAPFNTKMRFQIVDLNNISPDIKLGTYGVIQGATTFICAAVKRENRMEENLGYAFEKIILSVTSLGLGTCWLGGTFNKTEFGKAINLNEDETIPVITPIGYAKEKRSILDRVVAAAAGARNRKDWAELFFDKDFTKPLKKEETALFTECLDMVRIAPSTSNKQPWRIIQDGNIYHFFLCRSTGYRKVLNFDIQRLDIGIAMCHFESTLHALGGSGNWSDMNPGVPCSNNIEYIISYTVNS